MNIAFIFPLRQLHWWLGTAVVVLALIVIGLKVLEKRRQNRLERFVDITLAPRLILGYSDRVRRPLFWLTVLGAVALILTFFQPHWGQSWQTVSRQSHDIVICLDTSESMRAANPLPTRMERAKQKILSLVDRSPGDRFALVAFSGAPALQCPLTHDHGYFKTILNVIDTDTVSKEGTDIASAIKEAQKVFEEDTQAWSVVDKNSRAILLISDGEQVSGDAVKEAEAVSKYANVYVIGIGDPHGAEITLPDWMTQYARMSVPAKPHLSKLDEENLQKIALNGGGAYSRSTPDNTDIDWIYDIIQKMSAYSISSDVRMRLVNRYQWPLAIAIFCFAGEGLWLAVMPWLRRRRLKYATEENSSSNFGTSGPAAESSHA